VCSRNLNTQKLGWGVADCLKVCVPLPYYLWRRGQKTVNPFSLAVFNSISICKIYTICNHIFLYATHAFQLKEKGCVLRVLAGRNVVWIFAISRICLFLSHGCCCRWLKAEVKGFELPAYRAVPAFNTILPIPLPPFRDSSLMYVNSLKLQILLLVDC